MSQYPDTIQNKSQPVIAPEGCLPVHQDTPAQGGSGIGRWRWIAEAAYYKAEARGFVPGFETADWLAAEQDYVGMLTKNFLAASKDDGDMSMAGLRQLAKSLGVAGAGSIFSETELIRLIQTASHQRPCFRAKPGEFCPEQPACQWRSECQKLIAAWSR